MRSRIRSITALAATYPLSACLAAGFLLLHTGLRLLLMAQTWHAAQLTLASAATVLGVGLAFDLVTLSMVLPAIPLLECALGTRKLTGPGLVRRGLILETAAFGLYAMGFGVMRGMVLLGRVRRALQFHRGGLPDLYARSSRQHPRELPGRHPAEYARRPHPDAGVGQPQQARARTPAAPSRTAPHRAAPRRSRIVVWLSSVVIAIGLSWAWSIDARCGANEYQLELSANGLYNPHSRLDRLATPGLMPGYLTTNQLVVLRPGRKIEDWRLNAQMEIVAPVRQPDPVVSRAIGAYQETARRARDGLLQHVNLSDGLRMR